VKDEREKTDDSLRAERLNTDDILTGDRAAAEREADGVVEEARDVADAVLSAARRKADDASLSPAGGAVDPDMVARYRVAADRVVRSERTRADVVLRDDRAEQADVLATLLVHERAATDAFLLTERARADDALEHRDDFLGIVAHDVRNLLNSMVFSVEVLRHERNGAKLDPEALAAANRIERYVARMNRLIGDLVDVTSIDAGKLSIVLAPGDAVVLLAEATEIFQPAALEKGVLLSADVDAQPLLAEFDRGRLLQVFANLLSNAIKFTAAGGRIGVGVRRSDTELRFCVTDTGVGIAPALADAIFERFWQVGSDDRRGLGLGLHISKCIVEAHRGRIWVESAPMQGSRFYFTLPLSTS
jgi:signal transduction histidine kinase